MITELTENIFHDGIASQTGFLKSSWDHLVEEQGEKVAAKIALCSIAEPPLIVALTQTDKLPSGITPHEDLRFGVVQDGIDLDSLFSQSTSLRVQDPTSAGSLYLAKDLQPKRILDVCAGRGTKTKQLRALFRRGPAKKRRNKVVDSPAILVANERFLSQVCEPPK